MAKDVESMRPAPSRRPRRGKEPVATVSRRLIELAVDLGVEQAYGLVGGAIAPFADELTRSSIRALAFRHESGAAFAAIEASLATNRPVLLYTTTGPGLFNALNGLAAARDEGARIIVVSAATAPARIGRFAVQETGPLSLGGPDLFGGRLFDLAVSLADPTVLAALGRRAAELLMRPGAALIHLALPVSAQRAEGPQRVELPAQLSRTPMSSDEAGVAARMLADGRTALWVGFGARHAVQEVRAVAERTGALVMCTPRAKGIFPEEHPQFVGVTGVAGHDNVKHACRERDIAHAVVLGSRLGELSTMWDEELLPPHGLLHVDVDPGVFGAAFPSVATVGIQADVGAFLREVLHHLDDGRPAPNPAALGLARPARLELRDAGPVRPQVLMDVVQDVVIDGARAVVMAECGNAFTWAIRHLRFSQPQFRMAGSWGSMGHMTCGVVGSALARRQKAVALVGDGAMLMQNEVSTAVQYQVPAVWIVLNDGQYGIIEKGMRAQGFTPLETRLPPTDFAQLARAMGAWGLVVHQEHELEAAVREAMAAPGPVVLDVRIDASCDPPIMRRIRSLEAMGPQSQS